MNKDKIDILCEYLNNNVAQRYPISNEELLNSTDYIKNGYLKMLAVVIQQSEEVSDSQLEIYKRIVSGAKTDKSVEDYLRMALDIEIEDYLGFSNECKELNLKYRWLLDALIITCVQEHKPEQLALVACFCESFEITTNELKYIAAMAKAIVCMNVTDYVSAYEIKEDTIPDTIFSDYMYLISNSCICTNENMTIFQASHKEDVTAQVLEKIKEITTPCIKIIGAYIEVENYTLEFKNREKVYLENCTFIGGSKNPIFFSSCKEVVLKDCSFENFTTRTLEFNSINAVMVNGCKFKNCKLHYYSQYRDWSEFGGVISSSDPSLIERFDLMNSSFEECGGYNAVSSSGGLYRSAIISDIKSFVDNCSFTNCWHTSRQGVDPDCAERTMFTADSSATNCSYDNSARFN